MHRRPIGGNPRCERVPIKFELLQLGWLALGIESDDHRADIMIILKP